MKFADGEGLLVSIDQIDLSGRGDVPGTNIPGEINIQLQVVQ